MAKKKQLSPRKAIKIKDHLKNFVDTAKTIVNSPAQFFETAKDEKGYKSALKYLAILWIVGSLLTALANIVFGYLLPLLTGTLTVEVAPLLLLVSQFIAALLTAAVGVIGTILLTVLLHMWIKVFRGKGSLTQTFQINTYALTPSMLFGWLPIANIVASIFGLYLMMVGTEKLHKLSRRQTVIMFIVLPVLLIIGVSYWMYSNGITIPTSR